jgi:hypothetical protein
MFIFKDFSSLNFNKIFFGGKDPLELGLLELLPSGGFFERYVPKLGLHGIKGYSAWNHYLRNEKSSKGMVILPGIIAQE